MKLIRRSIPLLLCLLLLPVFSAGEEETGLRITPPSKRQDAIGNLTDGNMETRLTLGSQKSVLAEWDAPDAASLMICWYEPAAKVQIEVLDQNGKRVSSSVVKNTPYRQHVNVTAGSAVRITSLSGRASISELCLFRVGDTLPFSDTKVREADLLIVCAGAAEECRLLGGLLPLYAGEHDVRTAILYIRKDYGYVVGECFEALPELGYTQYPVFMRRNDQNATQEERVRNNWHSTLTRDMYQIIRKIKPKVIVTLDPGDKTQPARTRVAARTVRSLVQTYAQKTDMPLRKFYVLSAEGTTVMDWNVPLRRFGGRTAYEMACEALQKYDSQRMYRYSVPETSRFRLVYTKVGEDVLGNDLFEHIDTETLISYAGATPAPRLSDEDAPEPTPVPAVGSLAGPKGGGPGALFCAAVCALLLTVMKKKRALAAAVLACLCIFGPKSVVRAETLPSEETAPEQTEEPAAETAPEPEKTPSPSDDFWYRQPGDPEEVILSDYPAGHWEYRSDDLSVIIDRETFKLNSHPQCIYVAYIRSRNTDCFHSGLAQGSDTGALIMPWRLARNYKAVLAITGDNLLNAEKDLKGILIRNGVLYSDGKGEDTLAVYSSQKIGLIKKGKVTGLQLLDSGVRNSFSFGPVLVENGEINPKINKHRVWKGNPRCGVGIIEEGCIVAIVADGRDPKRAYNLTLAEFAQVFKSKGVTFAYNLDGGSSEAMVFMGETVSCHSDEAGQRTWIDALMWGYSEKVPATGDPIVHNGEGKGYW